MSIEKTLERIADALEAIAANAPGADNVEAEPKSKHTRGASKPEPKAKAKPKTNGAKKPADDGPSKDDVRDALKALQKETDAATARGILNRSGAKSLTDLDPELYGEVIEAAEAEIA